MPGALLVLDKEEKEALSKYKILGEVGKERTWLELVALTGRKHQLRKHMAGIGCPIIGDRRYGNYEKKGVRFFCNGSYSGFWEGLCCC